MLEKLPITETLEPEGNGNSIATLSYDTKFLPVKLKEKFPDVVNPWRVLLKGPPKIGSEELVRFPTTHVPK